MTCQNLKIIDYVLIFIRLEIWIIHFIYHPKFIKVYKIFGRSSKTFQVVIILKYYNIKFLYIYNSDIYSTSLLNNMYFQNISNIKFGHGDGSLVL